MNEEIESMKNINTWELTSLPLNKTLVGSKWVFKIKRDDQGNVSRFKARLVAQGFSQKFGQDYDEVFAPVMKQTTLRLLLTIAGKRRMKVCQYDIETAYLNGDLEHEVYMKQPEGYSDGKVNLVCKLNKNIYGLKQGAREWNKKLNDVFIKIGYKQSINDPCLYSKKVGTNSVYVLIYVDDLVIASVKDNLIDETELASGNNFKMKKLGELKYFLGMQFEKDKDDIYSIHQINYIEKKLKEFKLQDCRPSNIPMDPGYRKRNEVEKLLESNDIYRCAIGSLLYLATHSRPDISVSVSILARKVENPSESDWTEVKRIFRYLKLTMEKKLKLGNISVQENQLIGYTDADWGGDRVDRKSNTGYYFSFYGGTISWVSKKQQSVTLSSTEAEYVALAEATQEAIWIERLLIDFDVNLLKNTIIYEDNQSCIKMLDNNKINPRTKHIETKYHFIRELKQTGRIYFEYCPSKNMVADILTKPLEAIKIRKFTEAMGLQ